MSLPGKFTNLFRKQPNGWKYALVIFSYDQPAA
jgi:hypothetical protein